MRFTVVAVLVLMGVPGVPGAKPKIRVSAELGPELDTNATRIQPLIIKCSAGETCCDGECRSGSCSGPSTGQLCTVDENNEIEHSITSGMIRLQARGQLSMVLGSRHMLSFSYGGGGKVFLTESARTADELVQQATAGWSIRVPTGVVSLSGSYYDTFQRDSLRDLRTGSGILGLTLLDKTSWIRPVFHLGYRGLQYKPAPDFNFHGLVGGARLAGALSSGPEDEQVDWEFALAYSVAFRHFEGPINSVASCPQETSLQFQCTAAGGVGREDLNHLINVSISYLGNAEMALWYTLEINDSNSHGESYYRQVLGIKFTTKLLWGVFLSVQGILQFSHFRDPYNLTAFTNIDLINVEEENRSRLVMQLSRDISSHLSLTLRYVLHVNESVTQEALRQSEAGVPAFLRQTLFGGLRFEYGQ